jgi:KaiC/GvpD/RAD55 family RecA-like ATPase
MTMDELISTGIEKLDKLLEGGIPKGYTILILGTSGSSIEILCKQLATVGKVLFFSTEETEEEIINTMIRFGWNKQQMEIIDIASEYSKNVTNFEQKRVRIYEQKSNIKLKELIEIGSSGMPSIIKNGIDYLAIFSDKIKNTNSEKIIINSLDFFLDQYSQEEVIKAVHAAKMSIFQNKKVMFIVMSKGIYGDIFEIKMEGISDCVLDLEVLQKGSTYERFLAVKKMKNYAKKIGIARYGIDSDGFILEMIERIM